MMSFRRRGPWNERGVAMVTVLFIGAALTAVTSVATVATIQEFRAGNDDRRAAGALAYAEAGVDRMLAFLRTGRLNFGEMNRAGCADPAITLPTGTIGAGTYTVNLTVYDPFAATPANRVPVGSPPTTGGACASRPTSPHPGQGGDKTYFLITSTGQHPAATRVIRQQVALEPLRLPIGIYANTITVQSAQHPFLTVSMVTKTSISKRKSLSFSGNDSYYKLGDFFETVTGRSLTEPAPSAAHSEGTIYVSGSSTAEFTGGATGTKNCDANGTAGGAEVTQSLWDSDGSAGSGAITSGCGPQVGYPNSSRFTATQAANFAQPELTEQDHQILADAAKNYGIYCSFPGSGAPPGDTATICFVNGVQDMTPASPSNVASDIDAISDLPTNDFVAYFHFRNGAATNNELEDPVNNVWPCSDDPAVHRSVLVVVKNGGVDYSGGGGAFVNGGFIIDGDWTGNGQIQVNGSVISKGNIHFHSSSQNFTVDSCWVRNMPGSFLNPVAGHWSEVDR